MLRDLSQPIGPDMSLYPGSRPVDLDPAGTAPGGARVTDLAFDTHAGTHVDAPGHTVPDGDSLEAFDPSAFRFDALLVDCTGRVPRDRIGPDALPVMEGCDMVVVHTGWDDHWGTDRYRDHPYLSPAAARRCSEAGCALGIDTFGPDPTPSATHDRERADEPDGVPAHDTLLGSGALIVENLTGLGELPRRFRLTAYPLALPTEASPVRAVAEF